MQDFLISWFSDIPVLAVPYALAALGLIVSERAGVLSLGAEGLMLIGALAGVASYLAFGGQAIPALVVSMAAATLVSVIFAFLVIVLRVNQVIAGLALVFFCQGLTNLLGTVEGWTNRAVAGLDVLRPYPLSEIPGFGRVLFSHDAVVFLTVPLFLLLTYALQRTNLGLRLRAVGENPEAADAAGISVGRYRFGAILAGSALVGLAGAYISLGSAKIFTSVVTGGRGWIAVALVIFAGWRPWRALLGALLFGGIEALIPHIAAAGIRLPQYFILMTPYVATLAVMVWQGARTNIGSEAPAALGQPYVREERR